MPPSDATASERRIGRYLLEGELGRGGMGVVHVAYDEAQDRRVALKVLRADRLIDEAAGDRFAQEMRVAIALEHPNVVPVHEIGTEDGVRFIAMRLVDGEDLGQVIRRDGALLPGRVARLGRQLGAALDAAHARGLVHRDVKPGNVLLTGAGDEEHLYLTDFGLTREPDGGVTQTGQWVGTVDYAAPEQIEAGVIGPRTDVYALGCVLYHALTGELPFTGTFTAKAVAHSTAEFPSIGTALAPDPGRIDTVLAMATAKDPRRRHASAGALARSFARAVADTAVGDGQRTMAMAPILLESDSRPGPDADAAPTEVHPPAAATTAVMPADGAGAVDTGDTGDVAGAPGVGSASAEGAAGAASAGGADADGTAGAAAGAGADDAAGAESDTAGAAGPLPGPRRPVVPAGAGRPRPRSQPRPLDDPATAVRPVAPLRTPRPAPSGPDSAPPTSGDDTPVNRPPARLVAAGAAALVAVLLVIALTRGGGDDDTGRKAGGTSSSKTTAARTTSTGSGAPGTTAAAAPKPAPVKIVPLATTDYTSPGGGYTAKVPAAEGWSVQGEQDLGGVIRTTLTGPDGQQLWIDATPTMAPAFGREGRTVTETRRLQGPLGPVVGYRFTGVPAEFCAGGCVDYQLDLGGRGYAVIAGPTPQARLAARTTIMSLQPVAAAAPPAGATPPGAESQNPAGAAEPDAGSRALPGRADSKKALKQYLKNLRERARELGRGRGR
ncbi:serine-threonine kinase [Paraconexibacter sp. AEG42_29]|uniref:non-specific serine/threonine protein kinase n=1 Tax=Paraconexibacter sp. AEG42_29 TaxID=2997339 RepID=A0AAU7B2Q3_9ACTN